MIEKLRKLGLSAYEAKTYAFLVKQGISTAYEISNSSGVPHGKIYPTLATLEKKGFLKKYAGSPQRFMAIDPQVIFNKLIENKEREASNFKQGVKDILKELGELSKQKKSEPLEKIRIIEGYRNYLNLSVSLHKKSKKEWFSISELSNYKPHIDAYRDNIKRGVKVRMLTSKEEADKEKLKFWKKLGIEIRITSLMPTKFSVVDDTDVTIRIADKERYISLWLQNPSLAQSLKNYFNVLWEHAEDIDD